MGSIYTRPKSAVLWISYYKNGKKIRESTHTTKRKEAEKLLKQREGEIASGKRPSLEFEKIKFSNLLDLIRTDYRRNEKDSARLEVSLTHLIGFFGDYTVPQITTVVIDKYIDQRLEEGAAKASVNRELAALKRMLNLGHWTTPPLVREVPAITLMPEKNIRKGFFTVAEYKRVLEKIPDRLRGVVTMGFLTGWRKDEIVCLTWDRVDLENGIVWLETGMTKNDEARSVAMDRELRQMFLHQKEICKKQRNKTGKLLPWVFLNRGGKDRVKQFDTAWKAACEAAGVPGRLFHDLRRSAVRNLVRSGVSETVAMKISGHKTRSVFDRYNIVDDTDLKEAAERQRQWLDQQTTDEGRSVIPIAEDRNSALREPF
ncbi:MAG TPA: site-specific integrase [Thermodesulfobacteriota bacterium]|nr:site-specific integrase [Thermodesulfobacteriota bacterium]HNU72834.1 site-specific integrase [Thermodesulfobacteriota bacterium]